MKALHSEIAIEAPPERVWDVLVDLSRYPGWNPFIVAVIGAVEEGATLRVTLAPPGGRRITLKPRVTEVRPAGALEWLGHVGFPGLFDGRHRFELHRTLGGGTRFVQRETFTGLLVVLFARSLDRRTARGFADMNEALKGVVEGAVVEAS